VGFKVQYLRRQVAVYYDLSGIPATGASSAASTLGTSSTLASFLQRLKQSGAHSNIAACLHATAAYPLSHTLHDVCACYSSGHVCFETVERVIGSGSAPGSIL
jgi:hypothetical protein